MARPFSMARRRKAPPVPAAHRPPPPPAAPTLLECAPLLVRLERQVEDEFRDARLGRLTDKVAAEDNRLVGQAHACPACGESLENRGRRRTWWLTRYGKLVWRCATYRCRRCRRTVRPLLDHLGVEPGRVSGSLARLVALLGVVAPYALAAQLVELCFGVRLSAMGVWHVVQRLGEAAAQHVEQWAAHHGDVRTSDGAVAPDAPDAVLLGVDGCALGMQVRTTRRRPARPDEPLPRVEEGQFREVKTGVLLLPGERVEPTPGRRSVLRRCLVTCLGDADQVFALLWSKLMQLGWLGPKTVVVIVGDGAEWIWRRAQMFPVRCEILDFWHAVEKAWVYARLRYGEESSQAARWAHRVAEDLRAGRVETVLARLHALRPTEPEQAQALAALIRYYTDNAGRMRYDEYLRRGYGIGSGAVESAHKQVVHARMRQAGMRWSELGARRLLALRVLLLNGEWALLDRLAMQRVAA
jgi:hypothetical protein